MDNIKSMTIRYLDDIYVEEADGDMDDTEYWNPDAPAGELLTLRDFDLLLGSFKSELEKWVYTGRVLRDKDSLVWEDVFGYIADCNQRLKLFAQVDFEMGCNGNGVVSDSAEVYLAGC